MGTLLVSGTRALVQVLVIVALALAFGVSFKGGLVGLVAIIVAATVFGIATACIGLIIALRTKSVQVTQNSWLMFMPLAFLTTALMPKELLTGWFKVAVTLNRSTTCWWPCGLSSSKDGSGSRYSRASGS